jgi:hypothetical protein
MVLKIYFQSISSLSSGEGGASANDFFDLSRLRLKSDEKPPPKNSVWPQLPLAASSMINAFAVANFAVRLLKG